MSIFLVTYDLKSPGQNYAQLINHIEQNYTYCKDLESVYLINSSYGATKIRDDLIRFIDTNDKLLVAKLNGEWASYKFGCGNWLNRPEQQF